MTVNVVVLYVDVSTIALVVTISAVIIISFLMLVLSPCSVKIVVLAILADSFVVVAANIASKCECCC